MSKSPCSSSTNPSQSRRSLARLELQHPYTTPLRPSRLRTSVVVSPEPPEQPEMPENDLDDDGKHLPESSGIDFSANGGFPVPEQAAPLLGDEGSASKAVQGRISEPTHREVDARTRLLEDYHRSGACGSRHCGHGTFSPDTRSDKSNASSPSSMNGTGGRWPSLLNGDSNTRDNIHDVLEHSLTGGTLGPRVSKRSTTKWLAERHGIKNSTAM